MAKKPKKPLVEIDPDEFPRLFKYLPLDVFQKYTNIEELIIAAHKETNKDKPLLRIQINKMVKRYHKQMRDPKNWKGDLLKSLDYKWPNKDKEYAKQ